MVQCGASSGLNTKIEPHHFYLGFISSEPALQYQPKSDLINSPTYLPKVENGEVNLRFYPTWEQPLKTTTSESTLQR